MIGRYAGSHLAKLVHLLPVLVAARAHDDLPVNAHAEIGVLFGGSLLGKLAVLRGAERAGQTLVGIDPLDGYYGAQRDPVTGIEITVAAVKENLRRWNARAEAVALVAHLSADPAAQRAVEGYRLLTLLIDGDHSYLGVKSDWESYAHHVVPGGFAIIDNYRDPAWPEVGRFCDELLATPSSTWRSRGHLGRVLVLQRQLTPAR